MKTEFDSLSVALQPRTGLDRLPLRLVDHIQLHTPHRTPLNKWSTCHRSHNLQNTRNIHAFSGTRRRDPSNQTAADLRLRPHGHRDWHKDGLLTNGTKLNTYGIPKTSKTVSAFGTRALYNENKCDRIFLATVFSCVNSLKLRSMRSKSTRWVQHSVMQWHVLILPAALTVPLWIASDSSRQGFILWHCRVKTSRECGPLIATEHFNLPRHSHSKTLPTFRRHMSRTYFSVKSYPEEPAMNIVCCENANCYNSTSVQQNIRTSQEES